MDSVFVSQCRRLHNTTTRDVSASVTATPRMLVINATFSVPYIYIYVYMINDVENDERYGDTGMIIRQGWKGGVMSTEKNM